MSNNIREAHIEDAQGIIEIDFTYLELKPFVKRDSKFWYLFDK